MKAYSNCQVCLETPRSKLSQHFDETEEATERDDDQSFSQRRCRVIPNGAAVGTR